MQLQAYLEAKKISPADFAQRIDVSRQAVDRFCRHQRIPRPEVMTKIVEATSGAVRPNDFYEVEPAAKPRRRRGEKRAV